jgi:hypothetical protein
MMSIGSADSQFYSLATLMNIHVYINKYIFINYLLGSADFQFYSLATPNGQKVGVLLEELGIDYDAHNINILVSHIFISFVI